MSDKSNMTVYRIMKTIANAVANLIFKRKYLRNEVLGKSGAMVIIGNHQAALDFTTAVSITKRHITFVVSDSFYNTLPFKKCMGAVGVIPKQQFQTTLTEISKMRSTVKHGGILMFYPAGLMSEDGLSTPIPHNTYKFLQYLDADVYAARNVGTYFVTPKWSKKIRPGRTLTDVYKIIGKEELADLTEEEIKKRVDSALLFDAYREQEKHMIKYRGCDNIEGLENVLYVCPHCKREFTMRVKNKNTIYCTECGFAHTSDKYGFLHNSGNCGEEIRYVSDWSRMIYKKVGEMIEDGALDTLSAKTEIHMIAYEKKKYVKVGSGTITLTPEKFILEGTIKGEETTVEVSLNTFASIPFKPGSRIEIQCGKLSYRCVLEDGRLAAKFVNMVENYHERIIEDERKQEQEKILK